MDIDLRVLSAGKRYKYREGIEYLEFTELPDSIKVINLGISLQNLLGNLSLVAKLL